MEISKWIIENKENIIKIIELEDVQSKNDPASQPYRSQYSARDLMQTCLTDLDEKVKNHSIIADYDCQFMYLSLSYRLANNFICTEERYPGEEIINQICDRIENLPVMKEFLVKLPDKVSAIGDVAKSDESQPTIEPTERGEVSDYEIAKCLKKFGGILMKIYNTRGMLWASRIMCSALPDQSVFDDMGAQNSLKYLGRSKCLYTKYKQIMKTKDDLDTKSKIDFNLEYEPPECTDSFILELLEYETPYLKDECNLIQNFEKKQGVKYDVFESDFTTTLFLLAQTFGKLTSHNYFKHKSAKYCYWTLARQLNALKYDPVEWAINAATLSQYYVNEKSFKRARHCIAAAEVIIKEAEIRPTPGPKNESNEKKQKKDNQTEDKKQDKCSGDLVDCNKTVEGIYEEMIDQVASEIEELKLKNKKDNDNGELNKSDDAEMKKKTKKLLPDPMSVSRLWDDDVYEEKRVQGGYDIDRCWINYGNTLLDTSWERMLPSYNNKAEQTNESLEKTMIDFNLELGSAESQVTCDWLTGFEEARTVFLFVQKKIGSAKSFYTIDYRCSDYVDLIQDYSKAFKYIAKFEYNTERKCCMHKKRIDMLLELLDKLNQEYYLIACRKMMLELGETYNDMAMLKSSLLESPNTVEESNISKSLLTKIRRLNKQGIQIYERFLETYRNRNGIIPEVFSDDDVRPVMIAHFYLGRMYNKIIESDVKKRIDFMRQGLYHYKFIVDYCNQHDSAARLMEPELESCRDMSVLLPCKIDKLLATIS